LARTLDTHGVFYVSEPSNGGGQPVHRSKKNKHITTLKIYSE
jgi:hypothetical protein